MGANLQLRQPTKKTEKEKKRDGQMHGCTHLSRFALVSRVFPGRYAKKYTGYCIIACVPMCLPTLATPWTAAYQAPPSMGFSRQKYWSGCHFLLQCMKVKSESEVAQSYQTLATPWTAAYKAPPSMGFSRQKYWSGCHCLWQQSTS